MAEQESAGEATTKVQEVAVNVRQAATRRKRSRGSEAEVTRRYFASDRRTRRGRRRHDEGGVRGQLLKAAGALDPA